MGHQAPPTVPPWLRPAYLPEIGTPVTVPRARQTSQDSTRMTGNWMSNTRTKYTHTTHRALRGLRHGRSRPQLVTNSAETEFLILLIEYAHIDHEIWCTSPGSSEPPTCPKTTSETGVIHARPFLPFMLTPAKSANTFTA